MSSFLTLFKSRLATVTSRSRVPTARQLVASSSFHSSAPRPALSEADKNRENIEPVIERENKAQLKKHKTGWAHWQESLASISEANVKADRGETPMPEVTRAMDDEIRRSKETRGSGGMKM